MVILFLILQVSTSEDLYNRAQEYNKSLQQYNSKLQTDLETASESLKRVEMEKLTIVENLSTLRGHYKSLQDQLSSIKVNASLISFVVICLDLVFMLLSLQSLDFGRGLNVFLCMVLLQASQDDAIKQKDTLLNELKCLRGELQQVRDDRDHRASQVQALTSEIEKHKEVYGKSHAVLDDLTMKTNALEVGLFLSLYLVHSFLKSFISCLSSFSRMYVHHKGSEYVYLSIN